MTKEIELLNYIYQNTQMAIISLNEIIDLNDDKKFNKLIKNQLNNYICFSEKTILFLNERDVFEKEIARFTKIKTYLMINLQTLFDKSTSSLAQMLIIGSTMGVIDIIKKMNAYNNENILIGNLILELKEFEEDNIDNLKKYL